VAPNGPRCRLYLEVEAGAEAAARLKVVLACPAVASILIVPSGAGAIDARVAQGLVSMAQAKSVAAILWSDARLARTLRAEGVHLPAAVNGADVLRGARDILGRSAIVGADAGMSRHDAMVLAEAGADYIGFGLPAGETDLTTVRGRRDDLLAWWAEIFEIPCAAFGVESVEEAATLADLGVDFVSPRLSPQEGPADIAVRLRELGVAIAGPATARGA
jgi:thiamine-phosphate pyrophosphorylase